MGCHFLLWLKTWSEVKWNEVKSVSHVQLFATLWTIAYQDPPFIEFYRQEYWNGLPYLICESCFFALKNNDTNMSRYYFIYLTNITPYDYHILLRGYSIICLSIVIPCAGRFQFLLLSNNSIEYSHLFVVQISSIG